MKRTILTNRKIRIFIVSQSPIFTMGVRALIMKNEERMIVGQADTCVGTAPEIKKLGADLVITDLSPPGGATLELIRELRKSYPYARIIALAPMSDTGSFHEAMRAGVSGYILKESAPDIFLDCLEMVIQGSCYITPQVSWRLLETGAVDSPLSMLTPKELRVLDFVSMLKTSREIGKIMGISLRTVQNHRANMKSKLKLKGSGALLQFALSQALPHGKS